MENKTNDILDQVKREVIEGTRAMSREERERLYEALHEFAYSKYEEAVIEGYDEPEMRDNGDE